MSSKITVGKIVANATENAWSQAYHAGGFTAVISVKSSAQDNQPIAASGKELLDTLVSEYFTLTTKDLQTVKEAVEATVSKIPKSIDAGVTVAAVIKNVLYIVIANEGRVLLKRKDKLGLLLSVKSDDAEKIASVSGFLENGDVVLLHTAAFGQIFSHDDLVTSFDHKSAEELAETFAPKVHETQNGAASALVFSYQEDEQESPAALPPQQEEKKEVVPQQKAEPKALPGFESPVQEVKPKASFSHRQRLFLSIAVILGIVLIGSVVFFQYRQQKAKEQALFASVFNPANTKYNEAKGLMDLNKALAIEDLQSAQQTLTDARSKFPSGSNEEKQITSLLTQVTATLTDAQKIPLIQTTKAADNASPLLSFAASHSGEYITQDDTSFYTADTTAVTEYDKKTNASKKLITNGSDWKKIGGFDTYYGNFYILDTTDGILKYVSGGGGYGKSTYFASGTSPDLSKAVSIAIDSSVWILTSDGTITRYTKGAQDSLSITGLDKPLTSPTEIFTNSNLDNIYVLDKGNERIVEFKKDGSFVAQYASDTVRSTSLIDVSEKDKKLYLLSNGSVYQLDLK